MDGGLLLPNNFAYRNNRNNQLPSYSSNAAALVKSNEMHMQQVIDDS